MPVEVRVPPLGESVTEATVASWLKSVGDFVEAGEPLVELETDKVTQEVPSPASGVLVEILPPGTRRLYWKGLVEVSVQATNLSSSFTKRLPVQVSVQQHDLLERANVLVSDLIYG